MPRVSVYVYLGICICLCVCVLVRPGIHLIPSFLRKLLHVAAPP